MWNRSVPSGDSTAACLDYCLFVPQLSVEEEMALRSIPLKFNYSLDSVSMNSASTHSRKSLKIFGKKFYTCAEHVDFFSGRPSLNNSVTQLFIFIVFYTISYPEVIQSMQKGIHKIYTDTIPSNVRGLSICRYGVCEGPGTNSLWTTRSWFYSHRFQYENLQRTANTVEQMRILWDSFPKGTTHQHVMHT